MSLQFLDDTSPPDAGPDRLEAVVVEAGRRRQRRQGVAFSVLGAALVLAAVVAGVWPRADVDRIDLASGPPSTIQPTTTLAPPVSLPATGPSIALTPLPATGQPTANALGGSAVSSGDSGPPACTAAQLTLATTVPAASANQGAIVRLVLTNVSGSPCTLVTDPCADSGFTITTPSGTGVSKNSARSCALPPMTKLLAAGEQWSADDIWSALAPSTPGGYVARGFWKIGGETVQGTPAPFELK